MRVEIRNYFSKENTPNATMKSNTPPAQIMRANTCIQNHYHLKNPQRKERKRAATKNTKNTEPFF